MISQADLTEAFEAIGARVKLSPAGMDFRVRPDEPGARVELREDAEGRTYFDISVNYTRVVDLRIAEVDEEARQLVLVADDWGRTSDAPPLIFRCGIAQGGWFVADLSETGV